MGMPMELNTMIVTKGKEERLDSNDFTLAKQGYRLYPLHVPLSVQKTIGGETSGIGIIKKLTWENDQTIITYELTSLYSVN
ncbi:MAG: DUF2584 domain-containing protein [Bacillus sp. (in: firmicutes)]